MKWFIENPLTVKILIFNTSRLFTISVFYPKIPKYLLELITLFNNVYSIQTLYIVYTFICLQVSNTVINLYEISILCAKTVQFQYSIRTALWLHYK